MDGGNNVKSKTLKEVVACCSVAENLFIQNGCHDVMTAYNIANHLHLHGFLEEAAIFYQEAIVYRRLDVEGHPREVLLLQVKLLCLVKAGIPLEEKDCQRLQELSPSLMNYVESVEDYRHKKINSLQAMEKIDCTFEQFHTGEEIDAIYVGLIHAGLMSGIFPQKETVTTIPRSLFFYWDQKIPEDVKNNIEYHQNFKQFTVDVFDKDKACDWLYQFYGRDAQELFLKARHPAEEADILRVHVINLLGGFWVDADLKIASEDRFINEVSRNYGAVFFLTEGNYIHNDLFGAQPQNIFLEDCLHSLYHNCYKYEGLFISYKTGPGIFMRASNRVYYRCIKHMDKTYPSLKIMDHQAFATLTEQYPVAYKQFGTWSSV